MHINKQSFVRAASEPPHPGKSLNSKSIILPVQEEREHRLDDDGPQSGLDGVDGSDNTEKEGVLRRKDQEAIGKANARRERDKDRKRNVRDHNDHLNQHITEQDLQNQQMRISKGNEHQGIDRVDSSRLDSGPLDGQQRNASGIERHALAGAHGGRALREASPHGQQAQPLAHSGRTNQLSNDQRRVYDN